AVGVGSVVFVLWLAFVPSAAEDGLPAQLGAWPAGWLAMWIVFRMVGSSVFVPLAEELAFRGYLTRFLIATRFEDFPPRQFTWFSFLASSALFGVIHGNWIADTIAAMGYAVTLDRRGKRYAQG